MGNQTVLTPNEISVLCFYYVFGNEHPERNTSAVTTATQQLEKHELIESSGPSTYRVTDRGEVHMDALRTLELPMQRWVSGQPK